MKIKTPKVSIIIPVYNVSRYLRKCLDSVVNQTLKDIEIIIVNDCSPDLEDDKICQEYANKDKRIVYIQHEKNLKQGGARNTGIKIAKAEYIGGVDSDDWIELNMYESLYNTMIETQSDIVCCGMKIIDSRYQIIAQNQTKKIVFKKEELNTWNIFNMCSLTFPNKLLKKKLFIENNIWFPEYIYSEDTVTIPKIIFYSSKIYLLDQNYYYYLKRDNSSTSITPPKHFCDLIDIYLILENFLIEKHIYKENINSCKNICYGHFKNLINIIFKNEKITDTDKKENLFRIATIILNNQEYRNLILRSFFIDNDINRIKFIFKYYFLVTRWLNYQEFSFIEKIKKLIKYIKTKII